VANVQLSRFHGAESAALVRRVGVERAARFGRWRDLVRAGVVTAGGTDFPHGPPIVGPVLRTLFTATTRIGPDGEAPAPRLAGQTLTTANAIHLLTRAAAWALREERVKGALRPHMLADLVVFSRDPLAVAPADLLGLDVATTVVGGALEHLHPDHADLGEAWAYAAGSAASVRRGSGGNGADSIPRSAIRVE
jgi:predicted amidohydrolase YtcJ